MSAQQFFVMCRPAFRYIPDEKSGDATSIGFGYEGAVALQSFQYKPDCANANFFLIGSGKSGAGVSIEMLNVHFQMNLFTCLSACWLATQLALAGYTAFVSINLSPESCLKIITN